MVSTLQAFLQAVDKAGTSTYPVTNAAEPKPTQGIANYAKEGWGNPKSPFKTQFGKSFKRTRELEALKWGSPSFHNH
jgi:hypothetical protein